MDRVKLILLVGIPGSGKTTYANKYIFEHKNAIHLSSDKIRAELYGDESTQGDPSEVFSLMQSRAIEYLNDGKNVIYDATNICRKDRANIIAICPKHVEIEAHVIWTPIEDCLQRDADRARTVGTKVIDKMLKRFQPPFYDEGIDKIEVIITNDFIKSLYCSKYYSNMIMPHDNPHHTYNIYEHCMAATKYAIDKKYDEYIIFAASIHDIGKPYTKAFIDSKGNYSETAHYYSHNNVGAWISYGYYPDPYIAWLVGNHMEPFLNSKYYNRLPKYLKEPIDLLHEADLNAH